MTVRPTIFFDFGNVVAHFDFTRSCERFGSPHGISGEDFLARAREAGFAEELKRYERGDMTSLEFHQRISALTRLDIDHSGFADNWGDIFTANPSVHRVIAALKRRDYRLFLGSNTNELHARKFRRQFAEVLEHFDGLVLSYEVRQIKPDLGFFLACAEAARRPVGECVFIDDVPENVAGARQAGLIGVDYTETPALIADLRRLGIEVGDH
jgi:FMN phosphatase YigB (HAD superfamily)